MLEFLDISLDIPFINSLHCLETSTALKDAVDLTVTGSLPAPKVLYRVFVVRFLNLLVVKVIFTICLIFAISEMGIRAEFKPLTPFE